MHILINGRKVENPFAVIGMVLFALFLMSGVIATVVFVLLPLLGIFISGILALGLVIITPIILWFVLPVLILGLIGWVFGKFLK